jgi:hypothetical protein
LTYVPHVSLKPQNAKNFASDASALADLDNAVSGGQKAVELADYGGLAKAVCNLGNIAPFRLAHPDAISIQQKAVELIWFSLSF